MGPAQPGKKPPPARRQGSRGKEQDRIGQHQREPRKPGHVSQPRHEQGGGQRSGRGDQPVDGIVVGKGHQPLEEADRGEDPAERVRGPAQDDRHGDGRHRKGQEPPGVRQDDGSGLAVADRQHDEPQRREDIHDPDPDRRSQEDPSFHLAAPLEARRSSHERRLDAGEEQSRRNNPATLSSVRDGGRTGPNPAARRGSPGS